MGKKIYKCNCHQNFKFISLYTTHTDRVWIDVNYTDFNPGQTRFSSFYAISEQSENEITVCQDLRISPEWKTKEQSQCSGKLFLFISDPFSHQLTARSAFWQRIFVNCLHQGLGKKEKIFFLLFVNVGRLTQDKILRTWAPGLILCK